MSTQPHRTILVVDDNEQALSLVREALVTRGYDVVTTSKGTQVKSILESKVGEAIDLIILDLVMPDADGMELAQMILERRPSMRILVVSGYADEVVDGIFERRNVDFLGKPFSIRDLFARVNALYAQGE